MFCNSFCGKREDSFSWVEGGYICLHSSSDLHIIVDDEGVYHRCSPETIGVLRRSLTGRDKKSMRAILSNLEQKTATIILQ